MTYSQLACSLPLPHKKKKKSKKQYYCQPNICRVALVARSSKILFVILRFVHCNIAKERDSCIVSKWPIVSRSQQPSLANKKVIFLKNFRPACYLLIKLQYIVLCYLPGAIEDQVELYQNQPSYDKQQRARLIEECSLVVVCCGLLAHPAPHLRRPVPRHSFHSLAIFFSWFMRKHINSSIFDY